MFRALIAQATVTAVLVSACAAPSPAGSPNSVPAPPSVPDTPGATVPVATGTPGATQSGTPAAVDPATVDPCSLVTADRVSEVIGEQVAAGVVQESDGSAACFFDVPGWPGVTIIPQNPGVSIRIYREPKTVAAYVPPVNSDQQVVAEVEGVGDAAWWSHHTELPNIHLDTDSAVLNVIDEPIQFSIAFTQIPNPVGVDKAVWLANATELANDVLGALGR